MEFYVDYIVKEEQGVVICVISGCEFDAVELVNKRTNLFECPCVPEKFAISDKYKGVARCTSDDTFNLEYGKKLAFKKAYLKYTKALEKKVRFLADDYKKYSDKMLAGFEKARHEALRKADSAFAGYQKILEEAK
jgi:hypothetical protein